MFKTVGIVGVGLIGGSLALAMRENRLCETIIGFDNNQSNLDIALKSGIIDAYADIKEIGLCDFVVVATPVLSVVSILKRIFTLLKKGSTVIDVGSVKGSIVNKVKNYIPDYINYVPTHPIAGKENFGPEAADAHIFKDAYFIITPVKTIGFAEKKIAALAIAIKSKVEIMDYAKHDIVFSYLSHLPHALAYALVDLVNTHYEQDSSFKFFGGGFRDFVRISKSNEFMWNDIFFANKDNILKAIDEYVDKLTELKLLIKNGNSQKLTAMLKKSRLFKETIDKENDSND